MNPYKILLAFYVTIAALVLLFSCDGTPTDDSAPLAVPVYDTVDILSPEQQIARTDALNAVEDALLAEYDTVPYYEEDHLPATFAPDTFASYKCGVWFPLAISQGWPDNPAVLKTLDRILWRESRCTADADSGPDHGLMQINQIHSKWLDDLGWTHEDMKDPTANLRFAWLLYSGREANNQCGWTPWSIKC